MDARDFLDEDILDKMPFGKYKGEYLTDLPSDYICWLLGYSRFPESDPDPEFIFKGRLSPRLRAALCQALRNK